jgi:hypothetical protein
MRVIVVPLYGFVKAKKALLEEYTANYVTRLSTVERHKAENKAALDMSDEESQLRGVYPKDLPYASIQSEFLAQIIEVAEKKGMTVLSFEMPEPATTKNLSDVPVLVRLQGTPLMFKETLKALNEWEKPIRFKQLEITAAARAFTVSLTMSVFRLER